MKTQFASSERSSAKEILQENKKILNAKYILEISEAINISFMILNKNRQIVFANKHILSLLNIDKQKYLGVRPGEILNCINSNKNKAGCGTHLFCKKCGAIKAILEALDGKVSEQECRISSIINNQNCSFDFKVKAQPLNLENENYILFFVVDISDKKRKEFLEKTFLHDLLNTAGGIIGFTKILRDDLKKINPDLYEEADTIYDMSDKLIKEIKYQQLLLKAENNNLKLNINYITLTDFMQDIINLIKKNKDVEKCHLKLIHSKDIMIETDIVLLQRILINLIKNAAEASSPEDTVTITYKKKEENIIFIIHNKSYIDKNIQSQIFQRSFSTKGSGRGIGTYSIKLFAENYLQGKVWFETSKETGTTFYLKLPLEFQN